MEDILYVLGKAYYPLAVVADWLGVGHPEVRRLIREKKLRGLKVEEITYVSRDSVNTRILRMGHKPWQLQGHAFEKNRRI